MTETFDRMAVALPARRCVALLLAAGLAGCAGAPRGAATDVPLPPGGYVTAAAVPVLSTVHEWVVEGRAIGVLLSEPAQPEKLPVVVYVPGLGESNGYGDRWRSAWAGAGYAVVSVQPLLEDESAWTSPLARDGDFKALGRDRYGAEATRQRLVLLAATLAEARRRSRLGEAAWNRIDWDRAAIAGFDLGAYSVLASLRPKAVTPADAAPVRFRAALAISPYASVARLAGDEQGGVDGMPMLVIGGDLDGDPLGIVDANAPSDRFLDRWRGPDRRVLWMAGLTHANLSGSAALDRAAERKSQAAPAAGNGNRRGRKGTASASGRPDEPGRVDDGQPDVTPDLQPAEARSRLQQAAQVSTAFLDSYVKADPRARVWLATSAQPWLGTTGELRRSAAAD